MAILYLEVRAARSQRKLGPHLIGRSLQHRMQKQLRFDSRARPFHLDTFKTVIGEHGTVRASVIDCKWNTNPLDGTVVVWCHVKNVRALRVHDAEFDDVAGVAVDVHNLAVAAWAVDLEFPRQHS